MPKILNDTLVVDSKGAVRIPSSVRKAQKIKPGTILKLKVVGQKLVFEVQQDPISILAGALVGTKGSVEEFLRDRKLDDAKQQAKFFNK
jgi:bifunctional DNA-binding transcriptional regulator/antitoxin component of YhaV-PrlF toxin-antitoxin module